MKLVRTVLLMLLTNIFSGSLDAVIFITGKEHLFSMLKKILISPHVIVEAGASDGEDTFRFADTFRHTHIFAFEPVEESYRALKERVGLYNNVNTFFCALGGVSGLFPMNISRIPGQDLRQGQSSSSLLEPLLHEKYSTSGKIFDEKRMVKVMMLDEWAQKNNIVAVDFIWLDTQGSELDILKAAPRMLSTMRAIYIEVEFIEAYKGQPLYREVKDFLFGKGFRLYAVDFKEDEAMKMGINPGDRWFGNALFVRQLS